MPCRPGKRNSNSRWYGACLLGPIDVQWRREGAGAGEWTLDRRAQGGTDMARIMILVVAYNAESTLIPVLERIPAAIMAKVEEIVVFDDASHDRTYEVGDAYRQRVLAFFSEHIG